MPSIDKWIGWEHGHSQRLMPKSLTKTKSQSSVYFYSVAQLPQVLLSLSHLSVN